MASKSKKSITPQSGQKGGTRSSRLQFPRVTLREAIKIPMALKKKNGGEPWEPKELAKAIGLGMGNKFFYLSAGSRDYGMTIGARHSGTIELSEAGKALVYADNPQKEKAAKKHAFMKVAPFRGVFEHYKGDLPEQQYLANTLVAKFGIPETSHDDFITIFRDNVVFLGITQTQEIPRGLPSPEAVSSSHGEEVVTLADKGKQGNCFVILPFVERMDSHNPGFFSEVLKSVIAPAVEKAGFGVNTAERKSSDMIHVTIVNNLLDADLVVADLTEHNPNVLFELGMRMADDKPVALIRAKGTDPLFDVDNMLRVYEYDPNLWPSTVSKDVEELIKFLKGTWSNRESENTYMRILRRTKADIKAK